MLFRETNIWTTRELSTPFYNLAADYDFTSVAEAVATTVVRDEIKQRLSKVRSANLKRLHKDPAFVATLDAGIKRKQQDPEFARVRDQNCARINADPEIKAKAVANRKKVKGKTRRLSIRKHREVIAAIDQGFPAAEIRIKTGVGRNKIQIIAKDAGKKFARRKPPEKPSPLEPPLVLLTTANLNFVRVAEEVATAEVKREIKERARNAHSAARSRQGRRRRSQTLKRQHEDLNFARTRDENCARLNANPELRAKALAARLKSGKHKLPKRKRTQVISALMRGLTTAQIRTMTGVGRNNIQRIAKDNGIVPATKTSPAKFNSPAMQVPPYRGNPAHDRLPLASMAAARKDNRKLVLL